MVKYRRRIAIFDACRRSYDKHCGGRANYSTMACSFYGKYESREAKRFFKLTP